MVVDAITYFFKKQKDHVAIVHRRQTLKVKIVGDGVEESLRCLRAARIRSSRVRFIVSLLGARAAGSRAGQDPFVRISALPGRGTPMA